MLSNILLQGGVFDGRQIQQLSKDSAAENALPVAYVFWHVPSIAKTCMHVPLYSDLQRRSTLAVCLDLPVTDSKTRQGFLLAGLGACLAQ